MIRDETVFVIGEEVARYNGAYKVRSSPPPIDFAVCLSRPTKGRLGMMAEANSRSCAC
jgi:hypothetical protein